MKFQNISIPGSKVMLCTRKRDEQTNEQTNERMHEQMNKRMNRQARSNMPPNFFQSWGHKYISSGPHSFREEDFVSCGPHGFREEDFLSFFHYKSMGVNDPRGAINLDSRGMVGRIYVGDHLRSLNILALGLMVSEKKIF